VEWLARVDGSAGSCREGVAYRNAVEVRRAEEEELLERLLSPDAAFIDGRDRFHPATPSHQSEQQ
jgi:hypothetical protein